MSEDATDPDVEPATVDEPALDGHKLAAARLWATTKYPYLASALFACPVLPAPGLGRLTIDRWWRVHADPSAVAGAPVERIGGELIHLASHVLRDHAGRADAVGPAEQAELHHWVDAADAEIADDLPDDVERVTLGASPDDLDSQRGRLAEEYYRQGSVRDGEQADCGSGAHGRAAPHEPPPPDRGGDGVDEQDQQLLRRRVASEVAGADAGSVPPGLRRWAADQLQPQIDWRAELAAVVRRATYAVSGAVDYSYSRPSRRRAAVPDVVLPSMRQPALDIAVVCDTSASVDDRMLGAAAAEIDGVLRSCETRSVQVLSCDDAVRAVSRIRRTDDLRLLGGGGTDLGVGLAAAVEARPPPGLIVVLTDGYTPWPPDPPSSPAGPVTVVVGMLATDEPIPPPDPPAWAITVAVGPAP